MLQRLFRHDCKLRPGRVPCFGSGASEVVVQIRQGLLLFLTIAEQHSGQAFPSPLVFELMDHVRSYGPEELRARVTNLLTAEPATDSDAIAAYRHTLEWLSQSGVTIDPVVWPAAESFGTAAGTYK